MGAEPLGKFAEFGGVHPNGKWATGGDRGATRTGTQTIKQLMLRIIHFGFIDQSQTWREALRGHVVTFLIRKAGTESDRANWWK
jgi:hypothetical protein